MILSMFNSNSSVKRALTNLCQLEDGSDEAADGSSEGKRVHTTGGRPETPNPREETDEDQAFFTSKDMKKCYKPHTQA